MSILRLQLQAHGCYARPLCTLLLSWVLAAILARVGIPAVDPRVQLVPRPFETLGTVAICLPAGLTAAFFHDHLSWLSHSSPRTPALLRMSWVFMAAGGASTCALLWLATLPRDVPKSHAFALWIVLFGAALMAAVFMRSDAAAVAPLLLVGVFSVRGLVPFDENFVYNVGHTRELAICAGVLTALAVAVYVIRGDWRARKAT